MIARLLTPLLAAVALIGSPVAQDWRWETNQGLGVTFQVHRKLKQIPMELGMSDGRHIIQKFEPHNDGDKIGGKYGSYLWQLYVLTFGPGTTDDAAGPLTGEGSDDGSDDAEAAIARMRAELLKGNRAESFEGFVRDGTGDPSFRGNRQIEINGKAKDASSKTPASTWWEYYDIQEISVGGRDDELIWYKTAASYQFEDKEVVLLVVLPARKGTRPESKWMRIAQRMVGSLKTAETEDEYGTESRDKYADTPEKQASLIQLKENIRDLGNWDYFTLPHYIITYSWEDKKRGEAHRFAREMGTQIESIRERFVEFFPPHETMESNYSVIRVCSDYDEFRSYGSVPYGVIGFFNPTETSKEVVVFFDAEHDFTDVDTVAVVYHEAWHQYSDQYFPSVELHRWYDEGLAEYFGAWRRVGDDWKFTYHKGRLSSLDRQLQEGSLIPSRDIVSWHKDKFYGPRAPDHYAQGWAMVDFLMRGKEKLGDRWNADWDKILTTYEQVCLDEKSEEKATTVAFEGIDIDAFDAAWRDWVERGYIKRR